MLRKIETKTGKARDREQAQPHVSNIKVTKEVDHASGPLYKSLVAVPEATECKIAFVRTGPGGDNDKYLEYTLTDTLLAGLKITGHGDRAEEELGTRLHRARDRGQTALRNERGAGPL